MYHILKLDSFLHFTDREINEKLFFTFVSFFSDQSKRKLAKDLEDNSVNNAEIKHLEERISVLHTQLEGVTDKLRTASKELTKQQAVNKSITKSKEVWPDEMYHLMPFCNVSFFTSQFYCFAKKDADMLKLYIM